MPRIHFIASGGAETIVDAPAGWSLMEAAVNNGVSGILADCGGALSCATCHVLVDPEWVGRLKPRSDEEEAMLEFAVDPQSNSRLSCQIELQPAFDGIVVRMPKSQLAVAERATVRLLAGFGALDAVVPTLETYGILIDPVLVDDQDLVVWRDRRVPIATAAPRVGWYGPELFAAGIPDHFLRVAAQAPSLVWLQSARAGVNDDGLVDLARNGVRVTTSDGPAMAMAEYVLAQVLDHFQRGPERRAAQRERRWQPLAFRELGDTHWAIVGLGAVGRAIANRARGFGVYVTGIRRTAGNDAAADRIVAADDIASALADADVVVLCVPLNRQTAGLADADFLAAMKPGAVIVNVGRGALIDETALRAALETGHLGHAILDVAQVEPLPPEHWFWHHPRVTLTPHVSGWGSGTAARSRAVLVDNLVRFCARQPLRNEVTMADIMASNGL